LPLAFCYVSRPFKQDANFSSLLIYAGFAKNAKPITLKKSVLSPRGHRVEKTIENNGTRPETDSRFALPNSWPYPGEWQGEAPNIG
ncbi:hypothetical protein, partial [Pseudophaeobacter arcticus]|uniref:hypothetical protein n=1 Tax=Pseudophaeobacter arcticus TaxID=385492 RepID=UPI0033413A43